MPTIPTAQVKLEFERGLAHLVRLGRVAGGFKVEPQAQLIFLLRVQEALAYPKLRGVARPAAWRYFATNGKGDVVAGEVSASLPPTLSSLRYGASAEKIFKATKALAELAPPQDSDTYLRVLRIPEALTEAFWLPQATGAPDVIVPIGKSFEPKRPEGRPLGVDQFVGTLRTVGVEVTIK